jgi:photosystem II stability/assembly factor-like uncharacterized protein
MDLESIYSSSHFNIPKKSDKMAKITIQVGWIIFILFSLTRAGTQSPWSFQTPEPQGNRLNSVSFVNDQHGFCVGALGTIIHTQNGGVTWSKQLSGVLSEINEVSCVDPSIAYAVGDHGLILKTTDAGENWWIQPSNSGLDLNSVSFTDKNTGVAVGSMGVVLRTEDGGINWIKQDPGSTAGLNGVSFTDQHTGTTVGANGTLLRTTDGGQSWVSQNSGVSATLYDVSFFDDNFGFIVGANGTVLRTLNGGSDWMKLNTGINKNLYDVHVQDPDHIIVVGKDKSVFLFSDGGNSFVLYHQVGDNHFYGACRGTIVGTGGQIFRTDDWGISWAAQKIGVDLDITSVSFFNQNIGIAVGDRGTILRTTNGGTDWVLKEYDSPTVNGSVNDFLSDVCLPSFFTAFAVCGKDVYNSGFGMFYNGSILKSTNGGGSWNVLYHTDDTNYFGVSFASTSKGMAVGLMAKWENNAYGFKSAFSRTTNGGNNWDHRYFTSIEDRLLDISYVNAQIVIVGENGRLLHSTNDGEDFSTVSSGVTHDLNGVSFPDENHGFIVGNFGTFLSSANGGSSWVKRSIGTLKDLLSVSFFDKDNGVICARDGTIFRTVDGGDHWFHQQIPTHNEIYSVCLMDNHAFAAGQFGAIFHNPTSAAHYAFENVGICEGESYESWMQTGHYSRWLTSAGGLDSLVETFLVVNPVPDKPIISQSNDTLFSSAAFGNQWYFNDNPIPWGNQPFYKISGLGDYCVDVTNTAGCTSDRSETISILTGVHDTGNEPVIVYPNPFSTRFTVTFPYSSQAGIRITDTSGKTIMNKKIKNASFVRMETEGMTKGIYLITLTTDLFSFTRIVEKL